MSDKDLEAAIISLVPADGSSIGNIKLRQKLSAKLGREVPQGEYDEARDALVDQGLLTKGRGRGGSVARAEADPDAFDLQEQEKPAQEPKKASKKMRKKKAGRKKVGDKDVLSYRHTDKRKNNPQVGLVTPEVDGVAEKKEWRYDPHISPELQFDMGRADVERLIDDALASGDEARMREALEELKHASAPYLNWTGKAERTSFEVDTVSLHVHERIDPASILAGIRKRLKGKGGESEDAAHQSDMFAAPFENLPLRDAVDFYQHERGWSNRLIAGDSLLVMNSLLEKEGMAGQVQMIYIDPPYGIRYGSNFQPFVGKRDVTDGKDEDLTQEPEMIKAFRDTWELGLHSYLSYLRDRLRIARELLAASGSLFVQISDDNIHHVREVLDEVFGARNYAGEIRFRKSTATSSSLLPTTSDYLVWYAKSIQEVSYNQLYWPKGSELASYNLAEDSNSGEVRRLTRAEREAFSAPEGWRVFSAQNLRSQGVRTNTTGSFSHCGAVFDSGGAHNWKTHLLGIRRLSVAGRLHCSGALPNYKRYVDDFPVYPMTDAWDDTGIAGFSGESKEFVVQTATKVVERCILMTTTPGDLVLDPTCGSGTTAVVAEKMGRRWVTCDTSRVAVTLAKRRLMTASFDYYELKYPHEGLKGGFIYKTVPHVTLKSIANNPEIDEIYERMHSAIESALEDLNESLKGHGQPFKVTEGGRKGQTVDFQAKPGSTVEMPSGEEAPANRLMEWEVPFDFPDDWPKKAKEPFEAFHKARQAMQKKMDESIAAHADQETLYDQPEVSKDKLRISGPFTVEAVPFPSVLSLDETEAPEEADVAVARSGESARQHSWRDELLKTGIQGAKIKGAPVKDIRFSDLETLPDTRYLHCVGTVAESGERVVVSFGPEHAALEQRQVELAIREAGEVFPRPSMIVFAAFTFDPEAAKDIDQQKGITALKAHMNTDLLTEDLRKKARSSQSFWLMGQPDVEVRKLEDGRFQVEVHGFDYYDTAKGELVSGGKGKIAMWSLDTDYDERSLYPQQVFFPMAGAKDGWYKLKRDIRAELDESLLEQFHGTESLPFEAGENRKVAVKIVDDRGIESLKVIHLDDVV